MTTSANALKICTPTYHDRMSYLDLHSINNRATPAQMGNYKLALLLYKLLNEEIPNINWLDANFQQNLNARNNTYKFFKTNNYKVGDNIICNRLTASNGKIELEWTMDSFDSYKLKCKQIFL